jgi:hypothetical protein
MTECLPSLSEALGAIPYTTGGKDSESADKRLGLHQEGCVAVAVRQMLEVEAWAGLAK